MLTWSAAESRFKTAQIGRCGEVIRYPLLHNIFFISNFVKRRTSVYDCYELRGKYLELCEV